MASSSQGILPQNPMEQKTNTLSTPTVHNSDLCSLSLMLDHQPPSLCITERPVQTLPCPGALRHRPSIAWKSCGQTSPHLLITWEKDMPPPEAILPHICIDDILNSLASLGTSCIKVPVYRHHPQSSPTLTSFSPQMLLMMELEAGLDDGPRTATTPLGRI